MARSPIDCRVPLAWARGGVARCVRLAVWISVVFPAWPAARCGEEPPAARKLVSAENRAAPQVGVRRVTFRVGQREIEVVTLDTDVEVDVRRGGQQLRIRDVRTGETFEIETARMRVALPGRRNGVRLSGDGLTLTRGEQPIVQIRPVIEPSPAAPARSAAPPLAAEPSVDRPFQSREFVGHTDVVAAASFSPDGRLLATGSHDGMVAVWAIATAKEIMRFSGHGNQVYAVQFSPDGRYLATAGMAGGICLRDARTWQEIRSFPQDDWVYGLTFSPHSDQLLSAGKSPMVRLWDVATGGEVRSFRQPMDSVRCVAISPDGRSALATGAYGPDTPTGPLLRVWDLQSGKTLFEFNPGIRTALQNAVFTADSKSVLAEDPASAHHPCVWDISTGRKTHEMTLLFIATVAISPDGRRAVAASSEGPLHLLDTDTWRLMAGFGGRKQSRGVLAFSPDGRYLVAGGEKAARLYRLPQLPDAPKQSPAEVRRFLHDSYVYCAKFSPEGKRVLSGGFDLTLRLWDIATGQELRKFQGDKAWHEVKAIAWSPDGRFVLVGAGGSHRSGRLSLWDVAQWKEVHWLEGLDDVVTCVAMSADGRRALAGTVSGSVRCWDIGDGREVSRFDPPVREARSVTFAPDGRSAAFAGGATIASGIPAAGADGRAVRLWEVATGREVARLEGHTALAHTVQFTLGGRHVVSAANDRTIRIWEASTGRLVRTIQSPDPIERAAFSSDERLALTAGRDHPILVWDLDAGRVIGQWAGHDGEVTSLDISAAGRHALSSGYDQTVRVWAVPEKR